MIWPDFNFKEEEYYKPMTVHEGCSEYNIGIDYHIHYDYV